MHSFFILSIQERAWLKCLTCGKVYTTKSSYYSHRRKWHPKLPRVEDIYRKGKKLQTGTGNKETADKSQVTNESAGGKLTTNRKIGGVVGGVGTKKSALANDSNITVKSVVNIKKKHNNTIENITLKVSNEGKRGKRSPVKRRATSSSNQEPEPGSRKEDENLKVANIVDNVKVSPKAKTKQSSVITDKKTESKAKKKEVIKVKLKKPKVIHDAAKKNKCEERKEENPEAPKKKKRKTAKEPTVTEIQVEEKSPKKKKKKDPTSKKHEKKKKKKSSTKDERQTTTPESTVSVSSEAQQVTNNSTKVNRRKSSSPRKSTGPKFSPLVMPERDLNSEPTSSGSPGSEDRALIQVAPVLSMKAYNSDGRPIHVKFVPVLAQPDDEEGSPGASNDEICASIRKQALDIAARVKDELISSGVRVSSTSTENSSDYLSKVKHQSPNSKQINISPLLPSNSDTSVPSEGVEENNNEIVCSEPLDLSLPSNKKKSKNDDTTTKAQPEQKSNEVTTLVYDPEDVIDIRPIEYQSGRVNAGDDWVVPPRDFRKKGRPPKPMKQKTISLADPSRVVSSMVINVDLE